MSQTLTLALPTLFLSPENRLRSTGSASASSSLRFRPPSSSNRCRVSSVKAFAVTERPRTTAGSFYEILRVKSNASQTEIKMAYRNLAKLYHPDASYSAESVSDGLDFIEIHNAYATLSDPSARAMYDMSLGSHYPRSPLSSSYGFSSTRRWETDQCW
ncbi:chaperone protein dnaJ 11, chloroplastic [Humulus lupulus]|uniref:chaperone protein dnaJ 11, chloroplastic n=1 Tax=Humulus lupulus TaxID=3486 RepID=UPI002B40D68B|nr:chaperone protein dnaJ 11, chloroplastic [Humulus lupulus]